jgi:hypothetical protein
MKKSLPKDYWLFESHFKTDMPVKQLYIHYFDKLPSKTKLKENFSYDVIEYLCKNGYKIYAKSLTLVNRKNKMEEEVLLVNEDDETIIEIIYDSKKNDKESLEVSIYYCSLDVKDTGIKIINDIKSKYSKPEIKSDIKLLKNESGYLDTEDFTLSIPVIDIELNYGEDFKKLHNIIVERLNKDNDSGIIFFHGDIGTGKTTYIKYLTSLVTSKDVIFVPPSTAESLSEPAIIPFLMDHRNSILIIEDGEKVITDRENGGSSIGVSNILNLTDGILGDCLNIQILVTFNMKKDKIDKALLRKGRLIAEHKFSNLSVQEANKLLKHLGKDKMASTPMSLADIYNIDSEDMRVNKNENKIGFN